ncbi:MAG: AzlC family ABC transporter permease [Lachnospiraceae bacterium]|nr:AzlC family ABC transporter permease [Lachnospiraceae bacterium]
MNLLKQVVVKTLPVMAGYIVLGMGFGILLKVNGYGIGWALLMSIFIYAGSMQYVGISIITGGVSIITTALTTLMVNARHLFYGISMIDKYKGAGKWKPYLMFGLTDETYSLVCDGKYPEGENRFKYWFLISLFNQIYWITGSIIGSVVGSVLKINFDGIEFSMTALFVTVVIEQWLSNKEHRPALIGLISAVICLLIFGKDNFLIPTMVLIVVGLALFKNTLEKESRSNE